MMALRKRTKTLTSTAATTLGIGSSFGTVKRIAITSSADTSVSLTVADVNSVTVASFPSADYTTRKSVDFNTPVDGPLTLTAAGLGSGSLTVEVYAEV